MSEEKIADNLKYVVDVCISVHVLKKVHTHTHTHRFEGIEFI